MIERAKRSVSIPYKSLRQNGIFIPLEPMNQGSPGFSEGKRYRWLHKACMSGECGIAYTFLNRLVSCHSNAR